MTLNIPADAPQRLYESIDELETPVVVVDLRIMDRNVDDYVSFAEANDVSLRSHTKTHKIPDIAHMQHRRTGDGIVCQTLGEVEVMAQNGIDDIYLSYSVVEPSKLDRLVWLSRKLDRFATTVDCRGNIDPLQNAASARDATVEAILEIDLGYERTGVSPGHAVALARSVAKAPNLEFGGVMAFEAHVKADTPSRADLKRGCQRAMDELATVVDEIEDVGIPVDDVKVGGTATSKFSGAHPVVTEINPGMYPFNDTGELAVRSYELDKRDCAVTVLATVISKPADDRVIVKAGSKSISVDTDRMPIPKHRDDLKYYRASEEHGWVETPTGTEVEVGDRIEFIVPHVCTTINLHDTLVGIRNGTIEEVWEIQGRGKVR